ncbi:glycosyltransferase [Brachybacterium halotolerans subsp. kimchii]|uniref:glycosyltransferase n=1 Tax=Brachybacterium halotolerans TaxID=2795215 RepID=UPI001E55FFA3|nr:glycosyltransferase [Brachybacterium halotolerans]UEJ84156.1 glycosyltransferase [Brachybacterium halotolerans subsp. kimchii]
MVAIERNGVSVGDLVGREVFIVLYALGSGGRTVAIGDQCRMFEQLGLYPSIVTFNFDRNFKVNSDKALESSGFPRGTSVFNLYEAAVERFTEDYSRSWSDDEDLDSEGLSVAVHAAGDQEHFTYLDKRGRCVKIRQVRDEVPVRTTFFCDGLPSVAREYDGRGFCSRELTLVGLESTTAEERYFTPDGHCYATRRLDPESGKQRGVFWMDRGSGTTLRFAHNTPWHGAWLQELLDSRTGRAGRPFAIGESASGVLKVLDLAPETATRLYMFHENHLSAPYTLGAKVRADYGAAPRRLAEMPLLVVPTNAQADDIKRQFGKEIRVKGIPNVVVDKRSRESIDKVPGRIGYFGRLAASKKIDELLRIFKEVQRQFPGARLDVFGDGPERRSLESLSTELALEGLVTFHGKTSQVGDEMAKCVATVSASATESFGLSVAESLAAGTPVVSYAVNYGPRDILSNGVSGFLIEPGDADAFVAAVVRLLSDPDLARRMGEEGAKKMRSGFSFESTLEAWRAAFTAADEFGKDGLT